MILKTNQCGTVPADCYIADAARCTRSVVDSPGVEYTETSHIRAAGWAVIVCKQLEATANCKYGHIIFNCRPETNAFDVVQILSNGYFFFVLASSNKQHIILVWR